jgi:hypothetical protein
MVKKLNIIYWLSTGLLIPAIGVGSIFDILSTAESLQVFSALGYPTYLSPFLGVAHLLGIVVLLIPKFPRLKEWAYAGFTFDIIGAIYSNLAIGNSLLQIAFPLFALLLLACSYIFYHKKLLLTNEKIWV